MSETPIIKNDVSQACDAEPDSLNKEDALARQRAQTEETPNQTGSQEPEKSQSTALEPIIAEDQTIAQKKGFPILAWVKASRPTFFVATFIPLFLGYFAADRYDGLNRPGMFGLILLACFLVHFATNLANDLFDYSQGVDTKKTIGGSRVIQDGSISTGQIKIALFACYLISLCLAFVIVGSSKILWLMVIFAAFSSFFYVCPPIKYGHRGFGEVFTFLNMGLIMTVGTHMALTGRVDTRIISLAVPVGVMVAGILYYQSLPEIETDKAAGKKTLAGILGKEKAALFQFLLWPLVWLLMINLWCSKLAAWPVLLGPATFPIHWIITRKIKKTENWLDLDRSGILIRIMYLLNGLLLILGVLLLPPYPLDAASKRPTEQPAITAPAAAPQTQQAPEQQTIAPELTAPPESIEARQAPNNALEPAESAKDVEGAEDVANTEPAEPVQQQPPASEPASPPAVPADASAGDQPSVPAAPTELATDQQTQSQQAQSQQEQTSDQSAPQAETSTSSEKSGLPSTPFVESEQADQIAPEQQNLEQQTSEQQTPEQQTPEQQTQQPSEQISHPLPQSTQITFSGPPSSAGTQIKISETLKTDEVSEASKNEADSLTTQPIKRTWPPERVQLI
ncbi:MAG: prenyltransferase [Deltaproteobacteria bacterium]|jgi:1,4-dihydroxy-2-naphthoate octaprenyltransferase|nr:prenyltransferase [Deltaproteobacteria bacterium]